MLKGSVNLLIRTWHTVAGSGNGNDGPPARLDAKTARKIAALVDECLAEKGGEVSARQRAARLGSLYLTLGIEDRRSFLQILAACLAVDHDAVRDTAIRYAGSSGDADLLESLRHALVGTHRKLLKQFNALPEGINFLVDLRADLLACMGDDPELLTLDRELGGLLGDWFDIGFLDLRRIDWNCPAALLEKLIEYEAVHEIGSWDDLRNRLEADRRCYAFFHPGMPDEPLIFIEVALVKGISTSIQELLDTDAPLFDAGEADTAIFYSISNTQKGLRGISFGNFLIKRVVEDLRHDLPNLKNFATLSPLPGFARWLKGEMSGKTTGGSGQDVAELRKAFKSLADARGPTMSLEELLTAEPANEATGDLEELREPLLRLCARYLYSRRPDQSPIDPVERFHLGNGSRLEQINWLGDTSPKGMKQSCGLMVNYLYRLGDIEKNHEAYAEKKKIVASSKVSRLLKDSG